MPSITNEGQNTLSAALKDILPNCDKVDALVGYFYFSGFLDLKDELRDKKIRILVGMDIDQKIIEKISAFKNENLDLHLTDAKIASRSSAKENYYSVFSRMFNDTDYFDDTKSQDAFGVFLKKIQDGSLEIKKTAIANHSKFYILHNKTEHSMNGRTPGVVVEGSSNLTLSGLRGQGEHNRILQELHYYEDDVKRFEELWSDPDNIDIANMDSAEEFITEVKKRVWLYALPKPILMFYKVLDEYFSVDNIVEMKSPEEITSGKYYNLMYQKDAINLGIDRINKFGGVIIADVVGLGKSIIASAIAHNMGLKTIIIAPPHLESQWKDYMSDFDFKGLVYSTGKIKDALERHGNEGGKLLIILDEAHKHRNEDTENYIMLHQLCAGNRVMALSATPFNNDPKDIYALIKLFSTPGQSTLKTVENLSMSFHQLFKSYRKLRKNMRRSGRPHDEDSIKEIGSQGIEIANELRKMIEPLVIRRSRRDLDEIDAYNKDLKEQKISFPIVKDPEILEYKLGDMTDKYINTLNRIASEDKRAGFIGARYKVAKYIPPGSDFISQLIEKNGDDDESDQGIDLLQSIQQAQVNVAKFMRRLLVRRFESSVAAFRISVANMLNSSEVMLGWYQERGEVPIYKKGSLPELDDLEEMEVSEVEEVMNALEGRGLIRVPKDVLDSNFERDLKHDIELLKSIQLDWSNFDSDPKYDFFVNKIDESLAKEKNRKIVIFTEFSDTADYIFERLKKDGKKRIFKYSSSDATEINRKTIKSRIARGSTHKGVVAFAKNGSNYVFAFGDTPETVAIVSPEIALPMFSAEESDVALETSTNFDPIYQVAKKHIFKDNTRPSVTGGRRQGSLDKLQVLSELYAPAKDLCKDTIKIIKDLDALPDGVLKNISEMSLNKADPSKMYVELKEMLPAKYLEDIFATAKRAEETGRLIVLSEELITHEI